MSAFDPKRTLSDSVCCDAQQPSFDVISYRPRAWKRLMRRRDFITLLGSGAATWPLAARAQQPALPVVTLINARRADTAAPLAVEFRKGLSQTGFVENRNVIVEYHWLDGHYEAAAVVIDDAVRRKVAVIATPANSPTPLAAKAATTTI